MDYGYIVRWQSEPENTKERPLHKPSQDQRKSTTMGGAWNFVEWCMHTNAWSSMYLVGAAGLQTSHGAGPGSAWMKPAGTAHGHMLYNCSLLRNNVVHK